MFYPYFQNNSGGCFDGPLSVVVEADSAGEADSKAVKSGLVYFDGVALGIDCECCGSRWYRATEGSAKPFLIEEWVGAIVIRKDRSMEEFNYWY